MASHTVRFSGCVTDEASEALRVLGQLADGSTGTQVQRNPSVVHAPETQGPLHELQIEKDPVGLGKNLQRREGSLEELGHYRQNTKGQVPQGREQVAGQEPGRGREWGETEESVGPESGGPNQ